MWKQVDRFRWELVSKSFAGKAFLNETNSGFIAAVHVENTDFDMELVDEREFFERQEEALSFLQEHMDQEQY